MSRSRSATRSAGLLRPDLRPRLRGRAGRMAFVDMGDQFLALSEGGRRRPTRNATSASSSTTGRDARRRAGGGRGDDRRQRLPRPVGGPLPGRRLFRHPVHEDRPDPRGDGASGARESERALGELRQRPCGLASPMASPSCWPRVPASRSAHSWPSRQKRALCRTFRVSRAIGLRDRARRKGRLVRRRRVRVGWRRRLPEPRPRAGRPHRDRSFCPKPDGLVRALARVGGVLYVGGEGMHRIAGAA